MKRTIAIAIALCGLSSASFAQFVTFIGAPQDDATARADVCERPELKPLHAAYVDIFHLRLHPLTLDDVGKIFGPKLEPATNWTSYGGPKHPADLVLPLFAPGDQNRGQLVLMLSGVRPTPPTVDKRHTDIHAIGDIGYVECYYGIDGEQKETAIIYFRVDDKFVPLASTNDFYKRLDWEKAKFDTLNKWLDAHIPQTDLGEVEIPVVVMRNHPPQPFPEKHIDLGGGTTCILGASITGSGEASFCQVGVVKDTPNLDERTKSRQEEDFINRPVGPMSFSMDGKFYRLTPKLVDKLQEDIR
jgi:hypothetical protein